MSEHTPEPWRVGKCRPYMGVVVSDTPVPEIGGSAEVDYYGGHLIGESITPANARRIVACVNACAGIETERLESGNPEWWGRYVRDDRPAMEREIAKLRAELEELQRRVDTYERAWLAENGRACNLFDKVGTLSQLLERHLADNADGERNRCNCQLCIDTRAALAEKEE